MHPRKKNCLDGRTAQGGTTLSYMKYTVKCMYQDGVRLNCTQIEQASAHIGVVVIEEASSGPAKRLGRKARLLDLTDSDPQWDAIPALFNAEMLGLDRGHMMIYGYQIHIYMVIGVVRQDAQCWLLSRLPGY
jgi:hypothetical protein